MTVSPRFSSPKRRLLALQKPPAAGDYATFATTAGDLSEKSRPRPPTETYGTSSWFTRLVFGYARSILDLGNTRRLEMDDLWALEGDTRASVAYRRYKRNYLEHDRSIVRAMIATYGSTFGLCGIGSLVMAGCAVFAPAVLHHVIDSFSAPEMDVGGMLRWIGAFFASRLLNAFCEAHVNFHIELALLQLTGSLKGLIFEKAMRRSLQSRNDREMIDVSNLFTSDVDNMLWAGFQVNAVWIMPIQVSVVIYMLYQILDVAAFAGLGVIFLSMFINYLVGQESSKAFNDIMKNKDSRMKAVKEVFGAIQIVKLNAWEDKFLERIGSARRAELTAIARYLYMVAVSIFLFWSSPLFVSTTSFVTYALILKKDLTAAKVFTAMVLFNSIRDPLSQFPESLQALL